MAWLALSVISAVLCIPLAVKLNINKGSVRNIRPIKTRGDAVLYLLFGLTIAGVLVPLYLVSGGR